MYMMTITLEAFPAEFTPVSLAGGRPLDISVPTRQRGEGNVGGRISRGEALLSASHVGVASSDAV